MRIFFVSLIMFGMLATGALASQDVRYAGFAFVGNFADIPTRFHYAHALNSQKDGDGRSVFDKEVQKFFQENGSKMSGINLLMGEQSDTKIAVALGLTRENISVVKIDDVFKVVVNLSCNLTFLNFDGMNVLATYPIYLEFIDVRREEPSEEYKMDLVKRLFFSDDFSVLKILKDRIGDVRLSNGSVLSMKIENVIIEDEAKDVLKEYTNDFGAFESTLAQRFSDTLSSRLGVSLLPYAKDYLGGRMSLVFSDARTQDFQIPDASYGIDLILRKMTKGLYKEGIGDDAYLYGIYTTVKVYAPALERTYWDQKVKYGAIKNIPKLQVTTDDYAVYDEITGAVMGEIINEIQKDKQFYKEVVKRCLNK
jgi:hypothetical protein